MQMREFSLRSMASTNLSNSIIGTITMSHNDSLGLKLVFTGIIKVSLYFQAIFYVKNIFWGYKFRAKMVPKHGNYNSH